MDDPEAPYQWFVNGEGIETKESEKYSFASDNPCEKKLVIKNCEFIDEGAVKIQFVGGVESKAALKVMDGKFAIKILTISDMIINHLLLLKLKLFLPGFLHFGKIFCPI